MSDEREPCVSVREKKSSQLLISACDLLAFVCIWPCVLLTLKQEEVLSFGGSSHLSSLACQRTFDL